jgi:hypothetical protein
MNQVKEYTIVTALSPNELILLVNEKISEGWQPVGGISTQLGPPIQNTGVISQQSISQQAMVKLK